MGQCFQRRKKADEVLAFHKSIPGYEETLLVRLDALSKELGVSSIAVKDESPRFGLNAFKDSEEATPSHAISRASSGSM